MYIKPPSHLHDSEHSIPNSPFPPKEYKKSLLSKPPSKKKPSHHSPQRLSPRHPHQSPPPLNPRDTKYNERAAQTPRVNKAANSLLHTALLTAGRRFQLARLYRPAHFAVFNYAPHYSHEELGVGGILAERQKRRRCRLSFFLSFSRSACGWMTRAGRNFGKDAAPRRIYRVTCSWLAKSDAGAGAVPSVILGVV